MWERIRYTGICVAVADFSYGYKTQQWAYRDAGLAYLQRVFGDR